MEPTSFFDERYISTQEHARGLRSFGVVRITDPFHMPPNIYPCMETDPLKAQQEAYWAMHMPEHNYNTALYFGLAQSVPQADFSRIEEALNALPPALRAIKIQGRVIGDYGFKSTMNSFLEQTSHKSTPADSQWISYGEHIIRSFANSFKGASTQYLRYGSNGGRHQQGLPQLQTHVHDHKAPFYLKHASGADIALSAQTVSVMKLDPHNNTLLADSRDICAGNSGLRYAYNKEHVTLYEAPALVPISCKSAGAPETLCVHGTAVNKSEESMRRSVWGIFTDYNEASMARAYKAQYQDCIDRIKQQAFHQRNLNI
jgi:hypothetical protein